MRLIVTDAERSVGGHTGEPYENSQIDRGAVWAANSDWNKEPSHRPHSQPVSTKILSLGLTYTSIISLFHFEFAHCALLLCFRLFLYCTRFTMLGLSSLSRQPSVWCLQCFVGVGWVAGRASGLLAWLSVWSDVQICIWPSWCHCHSLSLASVKSRLVLPFWYWLTRVIPDKGPLNGCVCAYPVQCNSVLGPHRCVINYYYYALGGGLDPPRRRGNFVGISRPFVKYRDYMASYLLGGSSNVVNHCQYVINTSAVEFHPRTVSNFHKAVNWPVTPPSNLCSVVAVAFYLQFFDAITEKLAVLFLHSLQRSTNSKLQQFNFKLFWSV